ncbi:MAG: hypothetical protein V3V14_13120 [Saprospiraceae bacterium]
MNKLFEKYYNKTLANDECNKLEHQFEQDRELLGDYKAFVMMMEHIAHRPKTIAALNNLNEVHQGYKAVKPPKIKNDLKKVLIYLSIGLLIGLTVYYYVSNQTNAEIAPTNNLYAQYFKPATISLTTKGDNQSNLLNIINTNYRTKKYQEVINDFEKLEQTTLQDKRLILMLGNALIAIGNHVEGQKTLLPLKDSNQFKNEYLWYTGLSYLAEDKKDLSMLLLNQIPKSSNYFAKAQKIIAAI